MTPPAQPDPVACPAVTGAWTQVPTRAFPPYQGAPADADELALMATKSPGPIAWYATNVHWAQSFPYGVWPANEYVPPVEDGFLIVQSNVQMVLDSTTHGPGCHEGCQWIDNPTWEMQGDTQLLAIDTEGNLATLPSGNVFMLKFTFAAAAHGTLGVRAHVLSQDGQTYYTNELQLCLK